MRRRSSLLAYGLPTLALAALASAVLTMARTGHDMPPAATRLSPPLQPQPNAWGGVAGRIDFIGAAGLAEPSSEEIRIGTDVSGTVERVLARAGAKVARGDALFVIDGRLAEVALLQRHRDLTAAEARLAQARARVPGLEAELEVARTAVQAALADRDEAADMVRIADRLEAGSAITERELTRRRNLLRTATARVSEARARLAHAEANLALYNEAVGGASIAIEKAAVEQSRAAVALAERDLELRTVRAPMDGTVLQVSVQPGEYAQAGGTGQTLVIMGTIDPLYVRVDIDEADIPRWRSGATATATLRGETQRSMRLTFVRQEPLVVPKRALSGAATERVDTRVMQALYEIEAAGGAVLPGQQLDVFIEATGVEVQARAAP